MIMWGKATGDRSGLGLARFAETINGPLSVKGCKIRPMYAAPDH